MKIFWISGQHERRSAAATKGMLVASASAVRTCVTAKLVVQDMCALQERVAQCVGNVMMIS